MAGGHAAVLFRQGVRTAVSNPKALLAHRVRPFLARLARRFNRVCAPSFAAMSAALAMTR